MARHKSIERPPAGRSIHIEVDGVHYGATYTVDGTMVSVDTLLLGSRRGPLADGPPDVVAKILLLELVHLNERRSA
jgi:hypothetical protein